MLKSAASNQYATFTVGDLYLGVNVLDVQEVLRGQMPTRVPLAPEVVDGLLNLRGQIVPALDMRRLMSLPCRDEEAIAVSVVIRSAQGAVSLQVDEIEDVIELDNASFEMPPSNVTSTLRKFISGVHKLDGRLLLVLDTARAVQTENLKA